MKKLLSVLAVSMLLMTGAAYAADSSDPANAPSPLTIEQATQLLHDGLGKGERHQGRPGGAGGKWIRHANGHERHENDGE